MDRIETLDGNTAVAHVAYRINDGCAIFPISPSSPMAELADEWSAQGERNLWARCHSSRRCRRRGAPRVRCTVRSRPAL